MLPKWKGIPRMGNQNESGDKFFKGSCTTYTSIH